MGFTDAPIPWQPNQYERFAKHVKEGVNVPVLAVGRIGPSDGERILDNGNADFISMGRQLLADPNLVQRLDAGRPELVRPCINCLVCVAQNFWSGQPVCAVNPQLGHYDKPDPVPTGQPRHVVVVGGGPGGMECALVAAERGHRVTLLEASEQLGGTARFSALTTPVNGELVEFFRAAIAEAGVEVQTGVRADSQLIGGLEPDVVVVATGSRRDLPDLPGVDLPHVLSGDDLRAQLTGETDLGRLRLGMLTRLLLRASRLLRLTVDMGRVRWLSRLWMPIGRRVVVVNGDLVGTEIARFLADRGRTVHVLEPGKQPAVAMAHPRRWRVLHEARRAGVTFHTEADPTSISPTQIEYRQADTAGQLDADTVILAGDVRADRSLAEELSADGHEVHVVGDADEEWYIEGAVRSGHRVGAAL